MSNIPLFKEVQEGYFPKWMSDSTEKKKESQKRIDEQNFVYNPMFDYGGAYDFDLGKFIR